VSSCFLYKLFISTSTVGALHNFQQILGGIAYNVPAVYDVLAARISKCAAFAGRTKCAGGFAWEWSEAE
jgi:hypothetical protein